MKKIILLPNPEKDEGFRVARQAIYRLRSNGAKVYVDKKYKDLYWDEVETYKTMPSDADLCIVMGGDGSFLDAAPFAIKNQIPMLGINLGRIGFLSVVEPGKMALLDKLFGKKLNISNRIVLSLTIHKSNGDVIVVERPAINEVAITNSSKLALGEFSMTDSHGNSIAYRGDGLILATPTGSSAYSLSAGGPLVENGVEAICATPVCVHSFFNRPVLFGLNSVITVRNTSERNVDLDVVVDSRHSEVLSPGDEATIEVSDKRLLTIEYPNSGMLNTLRRKMEAAELKKHN